MNDEMRRRSDSLFALTRNPTANSAAQAVTTTKRKTRKRLRSCCCASFAYFALRCRQNCRPIKRKDNDSDCIPTCNCCTPEPKMSRASKEYQRTGGQSQTEAMPRVLTRNKIDKAHVSDRLSLSRTRDSPTGPIRNAKCAAHRGGQSFFVRVRFGDEFRERSVHLDIM